MSTSFGTCTYRAQDGTVQAATVTRRRTASIFDLALADGSLVTRAIHIDPDAAAEVTGDGWYEDGTETTS